MRADFRATRTRGRTGHSPVRKVTVESSPGDRASLLPRLIRLRDAPFYLGMDRDRLNAEVRPQRVEVRIGEQGVAFDRLDLDAWVRPI